MTMHPCGLALLLVLTPWWGVASADPRDDKDALTWTTDDKEGMSNALTWTMDDGVGQTGQQRVNDAVSRLQAQVAQLQDQRAEDRAAMLQLRESCEKRWPERVDGGQPVSAELVRGFRAQMDALKADLGALVRAEERQSERAVDVREWRAELDSVHSEWQKVRLDVQALKERREDEVKRGGQRRNNRVTIKWLQKSVEEMKKEMKELAQAQNVTLAIGQRGQFETGLGLLRSDVVALRSQWEEVRVRQDKDGAGLEQLRVDVDAVLQHQRETAASGQLFREQLSQFKDELSAATRSRLKNGGATVADDVATATGAPMLLMKKTKKRDGVKESNDEVEGQKQHNGGSFSEQPTKKHRIRHQGVKVRQQIEELDQAVALLTRQQSTFDRQLVSLRWNHSVAGGNIRHLWGRMADLLNATNSKSSQQTALDRKLEAMQEDLKRMDEAAKSRDKAVHELTDSVTGIDKLHSSTVQLFEALEALEDEYGKRIDDLHKEVSKFEFSMAKVTSAVDIIKNDQANHYDALKLVRADASELRRGTEQNSYKLAALRGEVLHQEATRMLGAGGATADGDDSRVSERSAIADLEARIAGLNVQLVDNNLKAEQMREAVDRKADMEHVRQWAISADRLEERISNLSSKVEPMGTKIGTLEQNLQKVYRNFPADCSHIHGATGIYQIFPPDAESPVSALCDMPSDASAGWTVVQQRLSNQVDFNRDWEAYKRGFGRVDAEGDFWLGNEVLHQLTTGWQHRASLRFDMWDHDGQHYYAQYESARVLNEASGFRLELPAEGFEGNVSDAMSYHNGMKFSTQGVDNDVSSLDCARQYEGGWWYNHCQHVNVNGKYAVGLTWYDATNNEWIQLQRIQMKIRPCTER